MRNIRSKKKNHKLKNLNLFFITLFSIVIIISFICNLRPGNMTQVKGASLTPTPPCTPAPSCLNSVPKCLLPQPAGGWCTSILTPTPTLVPPVNTPGITSLPTVVPTAAQIQVPTSTPIAFEQNIHMFLPTEKLPVSSEQATTDNTAGIQYDFHMDQSEVQEPSSVVPTLASNKISTQNTIQSYPTEPLPTIGYQIISQQSQQKSTNPIFASIININNSIRSFVQSLFKFRSK